MDRRKVFAKRSGSEVLIKHTSKMRLLFVYLLTAVAPVVYIIMIIISSVSVPFSCH